MRRIYQLLLKSLLNHGCSLKSFVQGIAKLMDSSLEEAIQMFNSQSPKSSNSLHLKMVSIAFIQKGLRCLSAFPDPHSQMLSQDVKRNIAMQWAVILWRFPKLNRLNLKLLASDILFDVNTLNILQYIFASRAALFYDEDYFCLIMEILFTERHDWNLFNTAWYYTYWSENARQSEQI